MADKVRKIQSRYQDLHERHQELSDYLSSLLDDYSRAEEELYYFTEFVRFKELEEEFRYFRENAHEEYEEDLPFPYLTL